MSIKWDNMRIMHLFQNFVFLLKIVGSAMGDPVLCKYKI